MNDKIYRLIDANINRATEGLRVAEDIVRFVLDESKLTARLKSIRHEISRLMRDERWEMRGARNVKADVGAGRSTKSEGSRRNILEIFIANMKRAEESVRVFEETSKLIDPSLGPKFKKLRFELYDIEKETSTKLYKIEKLDFDLYVISDDPEVLRKAVSAGARAVQLRVKNRSRSNVLKLAKRTVKMLKNKAILIINDYPDIALKAGADGVHVGQDIPPSSFGLRRASGISGYRGIRKMLGDNKIIGISASNLKEALKAEDIGADYIGFGPIFSTPIKPHAKPLGIKGLRKVMKRVTVPVVAIGGINRSNIGKVLATGCRRVAVIRAVNQAKDIAKATRELVSKIEGS